MAPVYIVDPFATTRAYDEALLVSLRERVPSAVLLTTKFNDRRQVSSAIGEPYFLRGTHLLHRRCGFLPLSLLKVCGVVEYFADLVRLAVRAKRERAILHWQWLPFPLLTVTLLVILRLQRPTVFTAHDPIRHDARHRDRLAVSDRWRYRYATRIVVHSAALSDNLATLVPALGPKIATIPHGLIFEAFPERDRAFAREQSGLPLSATIIGFFGLVRPHKGLGDLVQAWTMLAADPVRQCARLLIAGEWRANEWRKSEQEKALIEMTIAHDQNIVIYPGYLSDAEFTRLLNSVDVLILPYRVASQSGVALAALHFGIPLIATRVGALPDVMQGDLCSWVVEPGRPDELSAMLKRFLELDAADRQQLATEVRETGRKFSWSSIAASHAKLYDELAVGCSARDENRHKTWSAARSRARSLLSSICVAEHRAGMDEGARLPDRISSDSCPTEDDQRQAAAQER